MNLTHLDKMNRIVSLRAAAKTWAFALAAGAMLSASAPAEEFHPAATAGGIQVKPVQGTPVVNTNNATATIPFTGLEAPYLIQSSTNLTDWVDAGMTSVRSPKFSGSALATNVPPSGANFRLMMLGSTNWVGKWNTGALSTNSVFVGAGKCVGCHSDKIPEWSETAHARALSAVMDTNGAFLAGANSSCVVCHSVGNGQPGGFANLATTPHLANVGCEACHGSAAAHVNISGRVYRPAKALAAETCGGCHDTSPTTNHPPTYAEWKTSGHAEVTPDVGYGVSSGTFTSATLVTNGTTWNGYIINTNGTLSPSVGIVNSSNTLAGIIAGKNRQMQCGFCHSGATRLAMLEDYEARQAGLTNTLELPESFEAAETSPTCVVCHDPHSAENRVQLRNPMNSTNYYTMFTGSRPAITNYSTNLFGLRSTNISYMNDGFASQYNPDVQICAQCHNSRGARWDGRSKTWNTASNTMVLGSSQSFSRGPHHSVQYNVLIGILQDDYFNVNSQGVATNYYAAHSGLTTRSPYNTNQCATCHVPVYNAKGTGVPISGHSFAMDTNGCALGGCHTSSGPPSVEEYQTTTTNRIKAVVGLLNQWATNAGPTLFGTNYPNYLQNAWEYNTISALAGITNAGPTGTDAAKVPDGIKQARFNLYMVLNDGSLGVHNPGYVTALVTDASNKVFSAIGGSTNNAYFSASANAAYAPTTITFKSWGSGITNYSWDFGDGNVSTAAAPSNTYSNRGSYNVTLTVIDNTGTSTTLVRNNFIAIYAKPVPLFVADVRTGKAPLTVNFTNISTGPDDVTNWRWTPKSNVNVTNNTSVYSYTYTAVGTNNVSLRAYTPVGNVTTTSNAYIIVTP